jgi:hypothetical protein
MRKIDAALTKHHEFHAYTGATTLSCMRPGYVTTRQPIATLSGLIPSTIARAARQAKRLSTPQPAPCICSRLILWHTCMSPSAT